MPITMEQFRALKAVPVVAGVKTQFQRKCDWGKVYGMIAGQGWSVREVHGIALTCVGEGQSISRVRVQKYLNKLVEKGLAISTMDEGMFIYYVNPPVKGPTVKPVVK